jgi:hypothetical protein
MGHIHDEHPETIGRGRTMSRGWACARCHDTNRPVTDTCSGCGYINPAVTADNAGRMFVVWFRMTPTDDPAISPPRTHASAVRVARFIATIIARMERVDIDWHPGSLEGWHGGRRVIWLEVADVTTGTRHRNPTTSFA